MTKKMILILIILSFSSLSHGFFKKSRGFCKINQYGHNICSNEKALYITKDISSEQRLLLKDLKTIYKPVVIARVNIHEPYAFITGIGSRSKKIHIDRLMGIKACEETTGCRGDKVLIKKECQSGNDSRKFRISSVYEDETLAEDFYLLQRRKLIFKKTRVLKESCINFNLEE